MMVFHEVKIFHEVKNRMRSACEII